MQHSINMVRIFHSVFGHPVAERLTPGDKKLRELRVKLIAEELTELCDALGVYLEISRVKSDDDTAFRHSVRVEAVGENDQVDLVEAADALGDLDYVVQGSNLVFGIPAEQVMAEIQRSNLSKLGEDGQPIYREDGKILKGPNYTPPNIRQVLDVVESQRAAAMGRADKDQPDPSAGLRMGEESYGGTD